MWIKKIPGIAVNVAVLILNVFAILMIVFILIKLREHVLDKFEETVDLAEFVVLRMDDRPVLRLDTELHEERDRDPLFEDVALLPVMGKSVRPGSLKSRVGSVGTIRSGS